MAKDLLEGFDPFEGFSPVASAAPTASVDPFSDFYPLGDFSPVDEAKGGGSIMDVRPPSFLESVATSTPKVKPEIAKPSATATIPDSLKGFDPFEAAEAAPPIPVPASAPITSAVDLFDEARAPKLTPELQAATVGLPEPYLISIREAEATARGEIEKAQAEPTSEKVKKALKSGQLDLALSEKRYELMNRGVSKEEFNKELATLEAELEKQKFEPKGFGEEVATGATRMLPMLAEGVKEGAKVGAVTGTAGSVIPGVGTATGFGVGQAIGSTEFWRRQGQADTYGELLNIGVDPKTARSVAATASLPYALLETVQAIKFLPEPAKKAISKGIANSIAKSILKYGKTVTEETVIEGLQEAISGTASEVGKFITGEKKGIADIPESAKDILGRSLAAGKQAIPAMVGMVLPGSAVGTVTAARASAKESEASPFAEAPAGTPEQPQVPGAAPVTTPPTPAPTPVAEGEAFESMAPITEEVNQPVETKPTSTVGTEITPLAGEPIATALQAQTVQIAPEIINPSLRLDRMIAATTNEKDKKDLEFAKTGLVDDVIPGFFTFQAFNNTLKDVEAAGAPYVYGRADIGNLGGANAKFGHNGADDFMRQIVGDIFGKAIIDAGGIVSRNKGDELKFAIPNKTKAEVTQILSMAETAVNEKRKELGLLDIPHPKHGGLPTGTMYVNWGVTDGTPGKYGDMDRTADDLAEKKALKYMQDIEKGLDKSTAAPYNKVEGEKNVKGTPTPATIRPPANKPGIVAGVGEEQKPGSPAGRGRDDKGRAGTGSQAKKIVAPVASKLLKIKTPKTKAPPREKGPYRFMEEDDYQKAHNDFLLKEAEHGFHETIMGAVRKADPALLGQAGVDWQKFVPNKNNITGWAKKAFRMRDSEILTPDNRIYNKNTGAYRNERLDVDVVDAINRDTDERVPEKDAKNYIASAIDEALNYTDGGTKTPKAPTLSQSASKVIADISGNEAMLEAGNNYFKQQKAYKEGKERDYKAQEKAAKEAAAKEEAEKTDKQRAEEAKKKTEQEDVEAEDLMDLDRPLTPEEKAKVDAYKKRKAEEEGGEGAATPAPFSIKEVVEETEALTEQELFESATEIKHAYDPKNTFQVRFHLTNIIPNGKKLGRMGAKTYEAAVVERDGYADIYVSPDIGKARIKQVLVHEITHYGIRKFLAGNPATQTYIQSLYVNDAKKNAPIFVEVMRKNKTEYDALREKDDIAAENMMFDEWFARNMEDAEVRRQGSTGSKIMRAIRNLIGVIMQKAGLAQLSNQHYVDEVLDDIVKSVRKGKTTAVKGQEAKYLKKSYETPMYSIREEEPVGRPDLANPAITQEVRSIVDVVDEARNRAGEPEVKEDVDVNAEAQRRYAANPNQERANIFDKINKGGMLDDVETVIAHHLINRDGMEALASGNIKDMEALGRLVWAYRQSGTNQARAFRQRRDRMLTPEERLNVIFQSILTAPQEIRDKIQQLYHEGHAIAANKLMDLYSQKARETLAKLQAQGYDLSDPALAAKLVDPVEMAQLLNAVSATKDNGIGDVLYEYWINAILSSPTTHVANIVGNTISMANEMTIQRGAEALVNLIPGIRSKDAATFGELKGMYAAIIQSIRPALSNAIRSFKAETDIFEYEMTGRGTVGKMEDGRAAISGTKGRVIRAPGRALSAADSFFKTIITRAQVAAIAHRNGKALGLSGDALDKYIGEQALDTKTKAWAQALDYAKELTFQTDLKGIGRGIQTLRNYSIPGGIKPIAFILPFVRTPWNIFSVGLRKSPLGSIPLAMNIIRKGYRTAAKKEDGKWDYTKEQAIRALAEQLVAWGALAALAFAADPENDDEDKRPKITGTGTPYAGVKGKRELEQRILPPMSIRIGEEWVSYARLEPVATMLAMTIDLINSARRQEGGFEKTAGWVKSITNQARQKTFLQGISDVMNAFEDPDRFASRWTQNFITSWAPNIIRAPIRAAQANIPEMAPLPKTPDESAVGIWVRRLGQGAFPVAPILPPPKVDVWGREVARGSRKVDNFVVRSAVGTLLPAKIQTDDPLPIDLWLTKYNDENPDNQWYPTIPTKYFMVDGKRISFTEQEYNDYVKKSGEAVVRRLNSMKFSDRPTTANNVEAIEHLMRVVRSVEKNKILRARREKEAGR